VVWEDGGGDPASYPIRSTKGAKLLLAAQGNQTLKAANQKQSNS